MPETHSKYFFNKENEGHIAKGADVIIVTDNFSTPENIGNIIRLAANVNASKVIVVGSEGCRMSKVNKTAGAAIGHVPVEWCNLDNLEVPDGYQMVALETAEGAINLYAERLPVKLLLVLGNEKYGVSQEILKRCHHAVYIPMPGSIKSMNVSHAAAACLFEWMRQNMQE